MLGKLEFDAKGDIKQLDYVVYKWDAKGNYAELNPEGLVTPCIRPQLQTPRFAGAFLFPDPAAEPGCT